MLAFKKSVHKIEFKSMYLIDGLLQFGLAIPAKWCDVTASSILNMLEAPDTSLSLLESECESDQPQALQAHTGPGLFYS